MRSPRRLALLLLIAAPLVFFGLAQLPKSSAVDWFKADATVIEECAPDRLDCLRQALANIAYREGGRSALAQLTLASAPGSELERNCHSVVHAIGGAVYARTDNLGRAFAEGGTECGYGFYHGVTEQALGQDGISPKDAGYACLSLIDPTYIDQCTHGAGHAFGSDGSAADAVEKCAAFAQAGPQRLNTFGCHAGAFMEGFVGGLGAPRWNEGDRVCDTLDPAVRPSCYGQAAIAILERSLLGSGNGWESAASGCTRLSGDDLIGCVEGWSSQLVNQDDWLSRCALAGDLDAICAEEVGASDVAWRMPDPEKAITDCREQFDSDDRLLLACARGVGAKIDHKLCREFIDTRLIDACLAEERR
jgi:hypothetical protein